MWTVADIPDQTGRTAVVTGGNTGLGFEVAAALAARGAAVVLACRDADRATAAARRVAGNIQGSGDQDRDGPSSGGPVGTALVSVMQVDLASLASVRRAAGQLRDEHDGIDLLINNAGVMVPRHETTADGHELHFGVNHLAAFALTGLLLERMLPRPGARVVAVSSVAHRSVAHRSVAHRSVAHRSVAHPGVTTRPATEPDGRAYRWREAYARSKLANLQFTFELQRRLAAAGAGTVAVAAHPGNAETGLVREFPLQRRLVGNPLVRCATGWLFQTPARGALPLLRAATDPAVRGGEFYGPAGFREFTGDPRRVGSTAASQDPVAQRELWAESERLTGVVLPL